MTIPSIRHDMVDAIRTIGRYLDDAGIEEFLANTMLQDAVIRQIQIIGEAAKRVQAQTREAHPASPRRSRRGGPVVAFQGRMPGSMHGFRRTRVRLGAPAHYPACSRGSCDRPPARLDGGPVCADPDDYLLSIAMRRPTCSAAFGRTMVITPFFIEALTFSPLTAHGRRRLRVKPPKTCSRRW